MDINSKTVKRTKGYELKIEWLGGNPLGGADNEHVMFLDDLQNGTKAIERLSFTAGNSEDPDVKTIGDYLEQQKCILRLIDIPLSVVIGTCDKPQSVDIDLAAAMQSSNMDNVIFAERPVTREDTNLFSAILNSNPAAIQHIEAGGAVNRVVDTNENTLFAYAISSGVEDKVAVAKAFIDHNVFVNAPNRFNDTPLHNVFQGAWIGSEVLQPLFDGGADPGAKNTNWLTPLHNVIQHPIPSREHVAMFFEYGADPYARDLSGKTYPFYAVEKMGALFEQALLSAGVEGKAEKAKIPKAMKDSYENWIKQHGVHADERVKIFRLLLLEIGEMDATATDIKGKTLLDAITSVIEDGEKADKLLSPLSKTIGEAIKQMIKALHEIQDIISSNSGQLALPPEMGMGL